MPAKKPTKPRPPHPWDVEADREEAAAKRKVGKPRGRNGGRRVTTGTGTRVTFRASEDELALISAAAEASGATVPQFVKRAAIVATRTSATPA